MVRVTVGVEAHTHEFIATAHEDQKFGFSLAGGAAFEAARADPRRGRARAARPALAHRLADLRHRRGFEVSARRVLALQAQIRDERGVELPELDLGGGFGIAYTTQDDPAPAARPGQADAQDRRATSARRRGSPCRTCRSSRAGRIVGPAVFTLYEVGTVKDVDGIRTYVSVDGGMSDNIRTALYDASYSATLAGRASRRRRRCSPAWWESIARPGTSW